MNRILYFVGDKSLKLYSDSLRRELQACYLYNSQEEAIMADEGEFSPEEIASFKHFKVTIEEVSNPNATNNKRT